MTTVVSRSPIFVCVVLLTHTLQAAADASLFDAIRHNDEKRAAVLLESDASIANIRNKQGATALMYAALNGAPAMVKLLLDHGADPNAWNPFGATALMWAAGDPAKVKLLVDKGADIRAKSNSGRTPLIIASAFAGNLETIRLLLAKGADPKDVDQGGDGPLSNAAIAGDIAMLQELLAAGASVHERGNSGRAMRGMTPLMNAARVNCVECVRLLVAKGSNVNAVSNDVITVKAGLQALGELTPLSIAAMWGSEEMARPLLEAGASIEARDARGFTPLMFAVASEQQDARIIRLLLDRGAQANVQAKDGQSALSWARKWGADTETARLVAEHGGKPSGESTYVAPPVAKGQKRTVAEAAESAIALLQASNTTFFLRGGCVGCHHQMMSGILVGAARDRGLKVNEQLASEQLKTALTVNQAFRETALQRVPQGGVPMATSLYLVSLAAQKHPADAWTDADIHDLAGLQRLDGSWRSMSPRPPMEYSPFSETAYAIRALRLYAPPARKPEMDRRLARARDWLITANPQFTEERAMQLLGLYWAGAKPRQEIVKTLIRAQRSDGGWAQRPGFPTDAYATGQTLYALSRAAGMPTTDPVFRRGVDYLLRTQYADGSWHVRSRSVKFQPYFESDFPHEHDQWISAAGTSWAALALSLVAESHQSRAAVAAPAVKQPCAKSHLTADTGAPATSRTPDRSARRPLPAPARGETS